MTVREAEQEATRFLESWWRDPDKTQPLPVDPFALASSFGIEVRLRWLPPDESGHIEMPLFGAPVITLNSYDSPNRQRFTCAHEIGHYLRRQKQGHRGRYTDYRDTLAGLGNDPEEIFANQFAGAMLMPAHLVARGYADGESVEELARKFGTSTQAMSLRLRNLRLA